MTEDVFTVAASDPLRDVAITFNNHDIRHAPVAAKGLLVGMLSWLDFKKIPSANVPFGSDGNFGDTLVSDVMTHDPISVQVGDPVGELAEIFVDNSFHAVPVLDGDRIVGIVSTTDLIRFFLEKLS